MWANCRQDKEKPHSEKDLKYLDYEKKKSFQKQKEHIMLRKKKLLQKQYSDVTKFACKTRSQKLKNKWKQRYKPLF